MQVICPQCKDMDQKTRAGAEAVKKILGVRMCGARTGRDGDGGPPGTSAGGHN